MRLANGKTGEAQELSDGGWDDDPETASPQAISPDSAKTDGGIARRYCR
jgi:hypothetical protein